MYDNDNSYNYSLKLNSFSLADQGPRYAPTSDYKESDMIFLSSAYCFTAIPSPRPHRLDFNSHPLPSFRLPSLAINDHGRRRRRRRRVHCLRICELLDFHQKLIPYEVAWSLQKDIVREKKSQVEKEGECTDTLIVLQHPSVFTLGTASSHENLNFDINDPPFHIHRTERGGEVTYHGPGQVLKYSSLVSSLNWLCIFIG